MISLLSKGLQQSFGTTIRKHQFFGAQPSYGPALTSVHDTGKTIALTIRTRLVGGRLSKQGRGSQETIVQPWGRVLVPPQFSSVQSSHSVSNSLQPHGLHAAHQGSLSITNSRSPLKLMSIESVMPSSHFIFCCPFLLLPSTFPK